jgi:hypothetical protein
VAATIYDSSGRVVGTEEDYADQSELRPGMKVPFKIPLNSDSITNAMKTYGFTISWYNPDGSTGATTILGHDDNNTEGVDYEEEEGEIFE